MKCPDHPRELVAGANGLLRCPFCQGMWMTQGELEAQVDGAAALLAPETRSPSVARFKLRTCPQCGAGLTPLRIGQTAAWVDHCAQCDSAWVEASDLKTLTMLSKQKARTAAFASMSEAERKEIASGLAEATHREPAPDLNVAEAALAAVGVPVLDRLQGERVPIVSWVFAAMLVVVFLITDPDDLALRAGHADLLTAFTAGFAHFGWLHLIGNLTFLIVFGPAAERKLPRWAFAPLLVLLGPLTAVAQSMDSRDGTLIGGASGIIAGLIGTCLFLQPRARVTMMFRMPVAVGVARVTTVRIPLWAYGLGWAGWQAAMMAIGAPGVGWLAHLSGFIAGTVIGLTFRYAPGLSQGA